MALKYKKFGQHNHLHGNYNSVVGAPKEKIIRMPNFAEIRPQNYLRPVVRMGFGIGAEQNIQADKEEYNERFFWHDDEISLSKIKITPSQAELNHANQTIAKIERKYFSD